MMSISIHAPTRGATSKRCRRKFQCNYFNPRSHERSDLVPLYKPFSLRDISIHAPTRGATMHPRNYELDSIFQSTLPREERQLQATASTTKTKISIHAPTRGATNALMHDVCNVVISIHAPTRGATRHRWYCYRSS